MGVSDSRPIAPPDQQQQLNRAYFEDRFAELYALLKSLDKNDKDMDAKLGGIEDHVKKMHDEFNQSYAGYQDEAASTNEDLTNQPYGESYADEGSYSPGSDTDTGVSVQASPQPYQNERRQRGGSGSAPAEQYGGGMHPVGSGDIRAASPGFCGKGTLAAGLAICLIGAVIRP